MMKRNRWLLSLAFIGICMGFDMSDAHAQLSAGIKAGINLSAMSVDDPSASYGFTPGLQAGGFVQYDLAKVSFQMDIVYSRQGSTIASGGQDMKAVSNNVNFPIVVKYKLSDFNFLFGPQVGILTCMESDYHPVTNEPFQTQDYTKAYKKTDFGLAIGAGWQSQEGLLIELRYYLGLTDISNFAGVEPTRNRVMQFTVGYRIFKH